MPAKLKPAGQRFGLEENHESEPVRGRPRKEADRCQQKDAPVKVNSVQAEIDTGPPKSRKAPPESVTLGRGRSPDAFRTNQPLAQLKPSSKCFHCQFHAFRRREFIAMLAQEFGDCLSATIAPTGCLTFGSCTMDQAAILALPKG